MNRPTDTSVTGDGEMAMCKNCDRPIVYAEDLAEWLHYVSGISPCSVAVQQWAEPE